VGLRELSDQLGTALLVTSHNMVEVERLCERVMFLSKGQVVANGTPSEITNRFGQGDLEEVFLHLAAEQTDDRRDWRDKPEQVVEGALR
jgi:ABC-2 type transport system ATP-binding protein